ncbi:MAG: hypothetical protein Q7N95_01855 [Alphaproteobacteria bacterium]|nr:hypothetical protein [Alphaproteobacteria bacterium]
MQEGAASLRKGLRPAGRPHHDAVGTGVSKPAVVQRTGRLRDFLFDVIASNPAGTPSA